MAFDPESKQAEDQLARLVSDTAYLLTFEILWYNGGPEYAPNAMGGTVVASYDNQPRPQAMNDSVARALRKYLKRRLIPNEIA